MLFKTLTIIALDKSNPLRIWMDVIGHPITALLISLLVAIYTFGYARGFDNKNDLPSF